MHVLSLILGRMVGWGEGALLGITVNRFRIIQTERDQSAVTSAMYVILLECLLMGVPQTDRLIYYQPAVFAATSKGLPYRQDYRRTGVI
ncbi:uncharacterized protein B0T23DRAFT_380200 [Neurospora hispaniola]|uniref:Uncharacterized protein n=1 Tax=Neurospora hispaniola TaxID=588809 RepID=A0AAJ0I816_9PEZI|nr:hypothetical protein B0T23DRAFT_380200 [Neurospora hispaniola]